MNPRLARWLFSAWLCFLAACAVIPSHPEASAPAEVAAASAATPEMELARVVRERAELSTRYGARHPEMIRVAQEEETLRDSARAEDGSRFRGAVIRALSDELADVLQERRELAARYGEAHPQMRAAQSVILALTAAINAEVHSAG
jgi:uncharacterized protein involved in exopolysaccharide biosynthesis